MKKYLLDTNIISFYLRGDERLKEKVLNNIAFREDRRLEGGELEVIL